MESTAEQIVRRREIRKKKILENSDARWRKIMGRYEPEEPGTGDKTSGESLLPAVGVPERCSLGGMDSRRSHSLGEVAPNLSTTSSSWHPTEESDSSERLPSLETRTQSMDETTSSNGIPKRPATYAFPKKVSDTESRSYARCPGGGGGLRAWVAEAVAERGLGFLRACLIVLLATCTRLWLALGFSYCYSQIILLPFCLLEAAIYTYPKFLSKVSWSQRAQMSAGSSGSASSMSTSLLAALLMLCGISPRASAVATSGLQLVADLVSDFSLYVFSFVVFHVVWIDWVG